MYGHQQGEYLCNNSASNCGLLWERGNAGELRSQSQAITYGDVIEHPRFDRVELPDFQGSSWRGDSRTIDHHGADGGDRRGPLALHLISVSLIGPWDEVQRPQTEAPGEGIKCGVVVTLRVCGSASAVFRHCRRVKGRAGGQQSLGRSGRGRETRDKSQHLSK